MFATEESFKLCVQPDNSVTIWEAVEVVMEMPWFVATVRDEEEAMNRTFLLAGMREVALFVDRSIIGPVKSLQMVQPPNWSRSGRWTTVTIERIYRSAESKAIRLAGSDGVIYGGFPVAPIKVDENSLQLLLQLHSPVPSHDD